MAFKIEDILNWAFQNEFSIEFYKGMNIYFCTVSVIVDKKKKEVGFAEKSLPALIQHMGMCDLDKIAKGLKND